MLPRVKIEFARESASALARSLKRRITRISRIKSVQLFFKNYRVCHRIFAGEILADIGGWFFADHWTIVKQGNAAGSAGGNDGSREILFSQSRQEGGGIPRDRDFLR